MLAKSERHIRSTAFAAAVALLALVLVTAAVPGALAQEGSRVGEADTVYQNGFVYTVDGVRRRAQAFAVRDGKYLVVGSNDDMKADSSPCMSVVRSDSPSSSPARHSRV